MQLLTEAFRQVGFDARSLAFEQCHPARRPNDRHLNFTESTSRVRKLVSQLTFLSMALRTYDVFYFFYGRSLLPRQRDLPLLRLFGKQIYVHFRGSDVRPHPQTSVRRRQRDVIDRWSRYADRMFVSTPDLVDFVPGSQLLPQAIDLATWKPLPVPECSSPFVIGHAPNGRIVKGTEHVIAAVSSLREQGYSVDLRIIEGSSREDMPRRLSQCHLVIDQLNLGWYGNVAIEAMALARPVISYIAPSFSQIHGGLPVISATPETLTRVLRQVIGNGCAYWTKIGREGRHFVEQWHCVTKQVSFLSKAFSGQSAHFIEPDCPLS